MQHYASIYRDELLDRVVPFWMQHSRDLECGGYYTCLSRDGTVFDTDKFVWLQARQVWLFAMLCDQVERRPEWREMAMHGADFLVRHGRDSGGSWYFSLDRGGQPLMQPYSIFSDCFAAMAFAALYKLDRREAHAAMARDTFRHIMDRRDRPKGMYDKTFPGTRDLRNFSLPMILCNLAMEMEHLLDRDFVDALTEALLHDVLTVFLQPAEQLILENVNRDGSFIDSFDGRLLNPGHALEAMWFVMDLGVRRNDPEIIRRATDIALNTLAYGWDQQFGGIFYFMDIKGHPPQQLEWDRKLWWVHLEALICMAKAWRLTGRAEAAAWFDKVHAYAWEHFRDERYGEWYGYLDRRGEVLLPLKGGKWKGCFHLPRAMFQVWKTCGSNPDIRATGIAD